MVLTEAPVQGIPSIYQVTNFVSGKSLPTHPTWITSKTDTYCPAGKPAMTDCIERNSILAVAMKQKFPT